MTVRELIDALKKMPPEAEVETEGCDCYGETASVQIGRPWLDGITETDKVFIMRPHDA